MLLMRVVLTWVSLATLAFATDPPWSKLGTCFTPQGTLCRTIEYEGATWAAPGYGFNRVTGKEVYAFRSDGAMYESHFGRRFRYYLIPQPWVDRKWFVLPVSQQTTDLYDDSKEYAVKSGARGAFTIWASDDPDCFKYADAFGLSDLKRGSDATIAGLRTVQYIGRRGPNEFEPGGSLTEEERIYLAPSVGCTQMRMTWYAKNGIGVIVEAGSTEVTSFKIGEPDSHFFAIPPGYHTRAHR